MSGEPAASSGTFPENYWGWMLKSNGAPIVILAFWIPAAIVLTARVGPVAAAVVPALLTVSALLFSISTATLAMHVGLKERRFAQLDRIAQKLVAKYPDTKSGITRAYVRLVFGQYILTFANLGALVSLLLVLSFLLVQSPDPRLVLAMFASSLGLYFVWLVDFALFSNLPGRETLASMFLELEQAGKAP